MSIQKLNPQPEPMTPQELRWWKPVTPLCRTSELDSCIWGPWTLASMAPRCLQPTFPVKCYSRFRFSGSRSQTVKTQSKGLVSKQPIQTRFYLKEGKGRQSNYRIIERIP